MARFIEEATAATEGLADWLATEFFVLAPGDSSWQTRWPQARGYGWLAFHLFPVFGGSWDVVLMTGQTGIARHIVNLGSVRGLDEIKAVYEPLYRLRGPA